MTREGVPPGGTAAALAERLSRRLSPLHLRIRDDSARHAGHAGATSGGGHYKLLVVSAAFETLPPIERHRLVYDALGGMIGAEIHALGLTTLTPGEWRERGEPAEEPATP